MISVLVLTLNEETNLPRCMDAVAWSDDIVVLDDGSMDATVEIARRAGARVIHHSAGNELAQRTYAVREIPFKHPWVYNPDADEVPTPELAEEMRRVVADPSRRELAYRARFKTMFMGRWIKHASLYPTWVVRLFRPDAISFERTTNLRYVVSGPEGRLSGHFMHYTFEKGLESWLAKHNTYSTREAEENLRALRSGNAPWLGVLSTVAVQRRRALKELSFRLPFRPTLRFLYMCVARGGFLDGYPGLVYCRLLAMYERMIVYKMREIGQRARGVPV